MDINGITRIATSDSTEQQLIVQSHNRSAQMTFYNSAVNDTTQGWNIGCSDQLISSFGIYTAANNFDNKPSLIMNDKGCIIGVGINNTTNTGSMFQIGDENSYIYHVGNIGFNVNVALIGIADEATVLL